MAERMVDELLTAGVGTLAGSSAQSYDKLRGVRVGPVHRNLVGVLPAAGAVPPVQGAVLRPAQPGKAPFFGQLPPVFRRGGGGGLE